jgi:hypothetical protein
MEREEPTFQQQLALTGLAEGLKAAYSGSDNLESKASKLFAVSSGIIAAMLGFCLLPRFQGMQKPSFPENVVSSVVIALLAASLIAMLVVASKLWGPRRTSIATTSDTDILYDRIISKNIDDAYNQVLLDTARQFDVAVEANSHQALLVSRLFMITAIQVVVLCLGVVARLVCFWCYS